jgi:tetratricopeptide (TPR) repeat protein
VSDPIDQEIRILRAIFWSERDPEGRAFVPLADAYLRKGSPDEALSLLEDGLGRHPDFASAHMVAARAYRAVGARGSVQRALGSVLELDPGNASALRMKGELAESEGNTAVALIAFREALDRNPDYEDLPGRIERLALGMSAVDPDASVPEGFDPSSPDASAEGLGGPAPDDFDPIDSPEDQNTPEDDRLALARDHDHGLPEEDVLPEDDVLPQDEEFSQGLSGEGIQRGSAVAGSSTPFFMDPDAPDPGPGGTDLIDVDLVDADLVDPDRLEDGLSEAEPADSDFGIEDFPPDERSLPADGVSLDPSVLGPDRLELAPLPPREEEGGSEERRAGDLEAHEALAAERGAGRPDEVHPPAHDSDPNLGEVDVIDPFGFDPLVAPEGSVASRSEVDSSEGQDTLPPDFDDDDAPDWSLPSEPEGPRVSGVEPLPVTRTLGELYARQGLVSQAAGVFEALLERNPEDETLRARLSELRAGSPASPTEAEGGGAAEAAAEPSDSAESGDPSEPLEVSMVAEHDEASLDEGRPEAGMGEEEQDLPLEAPGKDASAGDGTPGMAGFSVAAQPIGAWFGDLLAWAPGAVPVEELAPGAVPIESLAPVGWAPAPAAAAEPVSEVESGETPPDFTRAEEALPAATATPPGRQLESPSSDAADQAAPDDGESSPGASRQDGFEGLDDFQDWLRSLDR